MSIEKKPVQHEADCQMGCDAVELLIRSREKDLGGFSVRRLLPTGKRKLVGPWIFFDHMGPAQFSAGQGIRVRPHPHINLATVTYLFEGEILHRDSVGSLQPIRPGDVNLMVAGRGIVHSERERPEVTATEHRLHGLQLWLALPEAQEQTDPAFYHYPSAEIPAVAVEGVPVRVLMGSAYGLSSPVKTFAQTLYVEASLQTGQTLVLPLAQERAVYLVSGRLKLGDTIIEQHTMAVLSAKPDIVLEAITESRIAIIGGESMTPRFIEWNFVSSRKDRIEKAKLDWQQRRFPAIPGDDLEYIPLPE
jgi:redox-sensitive bicupin YhaK (pirin superfamily)